MIWKSGLPVFRKDHASTKVLFAENSFNFSAEARRDVASRERIGHVGGEETDLRTAIEAASVELQAVERLRLRQLDHGIGQLDFAAGAAFLTRQNVEDFRLEDVA